jgi:hypothetical protein
MISDFKQIESLFKEIDHYLKIKVHIYVIGGVVLLHQGLKPATKDIDLVILEKQEFLAFEQALKTARFESKIPTGVYKKMNLGQILFRDDFRIDTFHQTVCRRFSLSEGMQKRAKKLLILPHLDLYLCSNEDIFVFKTFTEREGDLQDCIALAEKGLDWNIIMNELQTQIQHSGEDVWITWVGERLDMLVEKGLNIPIMDQIDKLRDTYFEELERKFSDEIATKKIKRKETK